MIKIREKIFSQRFADEFAEARREEPTAQNLIPHASHLIFSPSPPHQSFIIHHNTNRPCRPFAYLCPEIPD